MGAETLWRKINGYRLARDDRIGVCFDGSFDFKFDKRILRELYD